MDMTSVQQGKKYPKDALVIISMLKDMGINDFDRQAVIQLVEFTYRK